MSYAMKVARATAQGDPGLFGFLGNVVKGVAGVASFVPGPIGMVAKGVSSVINRRPSVNAAPLAAPRTTGGIRLPSTGIPSIAMPGTGLVPSPGPGVSYPAASTPAAIAAMGPGGACGPGYRRNKSKYFVEGPMGIGGNEIKIGERCVKSRRMNPLNPKAISRAIRRLESAKRATSRLGRITIRSGGCGCK